MSLDFLPNLHFFENNWLEVCAHLGLPVPPRVSASTASRAADPTIIWLQPPLPVEGEASSVGACLQMQATSETAWGWQLPEPVQEMGSARLEADFSEDLIQTHQQAVTLSRVQNWQEAPTALHPRLQQLIELVRCGLGDRDWLIFWANTASQIWLLGVFPWGWQALPARWLTGHVLDLPLQTGASLLSLEILKQAAGDWLDVLEPDAQAARFNGLESLGGQLCLRADAFESRLGGPLDQPRHLRPQDLWLLWRWPARSQAVLEQIWQSFQVPRSSLSGALGHWRDILRQFLPVYLEGQALIQRLCLLLEKQGLLASYLALHLSPNTRLHLALSDLRYMAQQLRPKQKGQSLSGGVLLRDPAFHRSWQLFLSHYGHFCSNGLDLEPQRLSEQSTALMQVLMRLGEPGALAIEQPWQHRLWQPIWGLLKRLLQARDTLLSDMLWALQQLRQQIDTLAQAEVDAGILQDRHDIWWLWPHEIDRLLSPAKADSDWHALAGQRRRLFSDWQQLWQQPVTPCIKGSSLQGLGLQNGLSQGLIWRCNGMLDTLPAGWQPEQTLLLAENLDPGWIPILIQVAGVILTGSALGQTASTLLREIGLPAVIACSAAAGLRQGQHVRLNADTGSIYCLD